MDELIKHKIFTMDSTKRDTLLTVAMSKFAKNGYKKTTTDEIILEAGISKGLLFHYFGAKKDLYIFLFEYAITTIMQEYYAQIDIKEKDILKRLRHMILRREVRKHLNMCPCMHRLILAMERDFLMAAWMIYLMCIL
jgi:AcrR family transcriptional regulator